ncbi:hypothetical protein TNCV_377091 [Trichonephila clavipes]|nr:hypothetical protein TNCV_377091 [Trichonephila clavipes]
MPCWISTSPITSSREDKHVTRMILMDRSPESRIGVVCKTTIVYANKLTKFAAMSSSNLRALTHPNDLDIHVPLLRHLDETFHWVHCLQLLSSLGKNPDENMKMDP